ncbi:MAG: hypothetical protein WBD55_01495 [Dehalococcoidia bacterium]
MRGNNGGPNTAVGKTVVSRNAVKHGIMSPNPFIIEGLETIDAWERHRDGIVESLAPEGALEQELAERIALLLWRLRRATRYETAVINHQVQGTSDDLLIADSYMAGATDLPDPDPRRVAAHQQKRVIPYGTHLDKIMRYETTVHRLFLQTLHELEALQSRRRGERPHLARLDISSPPSG